MRRFLLSTLLVVAGFAAGLVVTGRLNGVSESFGRTAPAETQPAPSTPRSAPAPPAQAVAALTTTPMGGPDFTRVASAGVRGVANISSTQLVRQSNSPFASDPFFRYFFGDQDDMFGARTRRSQSLGSGVIISADGYVVTNNHVVGENTRSREVTVALSDKREIKGRIIGTDPATDIALLKIDVRGLPYVSWGDSSRLQVGEWVLAIGSPFQLSQTVTAGIISATGRANVGFADYEDFIQTDAAINPGNSGGALINNRGELIGINTGIFSQSGGYQGIGFAVPSNLARHIIDDLIKFGAVRRGTIGGISIEPLSPQHAAEFGVPNTKGVVVSRMLRNSEAYSAGLRPGDIITGFNGKPVDDPSSLYRLVADAAVGSTATVRVLRDGRSVDLRIPVVADPRSQQ
ncbi:MAG: trypsin-like serine protease [Acidimicrobiia bacterium]|nr:trypsin-like serine protease [Acidimicrobiia bacterium]